MLWVSGPQQVAGSVPGSGAKAPIESLKLPVSPLEAPPNHPWGFTQKSVAPLGPREDDVASLLCGRERSLCRLSIVTLEFSVDD